MKPQDLLRTVLKRAKVHRSLAAFKSGLKHLFCESLTNVHYLYQQHVNFDIFRKKNYNHFWRAAAAPERLGQLVYLSTFLPASFYNSSLFKVNRARFSCCMKLLSNLTAQ